MSQHDELHNGRTAEELLADAVARIRRRYPQATRGYVHHPMDGADDTQVTLCTLYAGYDVLWPDEHGTVFEDVPVRGERFWLGDRDGDPYAELAEINRLLTSVYHARGGGLFERGELFGGWYLPLTG